METRLLGEGTRHIGHNKNNNSPTSHQTSKHQKLMETRLLGQGTRHISHKNNNSPTSHQTSKHQEKTKTDGNQVTRTRHKTHQPQQE